MDIYKPSKEQKKKDIANAIERFKNDILKDNRTIYGQIVRVSTSGMTRWVRFFYAEMNDLTGFPEIRDITFTFASILERSFDRHEHAFKVQGCGSCAVNDVAHSLCWRVAWHDDKATTNEQDSKFIRRFKVF